MRLTAALSLASGMGAFAFCAAFVPLSNRQRNTHSIGIGGVGWDNDNFLNSLGGNDQDRQKANDSYYRMSRIGDPEEMDGTPSSGVDDDSFTAGAEFTKDMVEKVKQMNSEEEDASQGGSMFREMMKRAQNRPPPPSTAQYEQYTNPPPSMPTDPASLSVEEQARMFREMMMQQQGQAAPVPQAPSMPPAKFLPGGVDSVGRKIGRNRDADAIQNTADLYFAQLKRDSTSRNYARYRGDNELANKVWHDPSIQEIHIPENPYLKEQLEQEKKMLDTAAEEMLLPEMFEDKPAVPKSYSGISYRQKLMERGNKKKQGLSEPVEELVSPSDAPAPAPVVAPVQAEAKDAPAPVVDLVQEAKDVNQLQQPVAITSKSEDEMRQEIRTLMGLMLKHRGGPGFGAGRLQGGEAERFEKLALELTNFLKQEAQQFPQESMQAQDLQLDVEELPSAAPETTIAQTPQPATPVLASAPPAPIQTQPSVQEQSLSFEAEGSDRIGSLILCVEGSIQMYKNAPAELKESVLVTLRAALVAALNTSNEVLKNRNPVTSQLESLRASYDPKTSQEDRIQNLISVIEGAIVMYKNAPPTLQSSVLSTLQMALLSAVNTCNGIIAENSFQTATQLPSMAADPEGSPLELSTDQPQTAPSAMATQEENIGSLEQAQSIATPQPTDSNSLYLEKVFGLLQSAAGSGKMGLREDLTPAEAEELAGAILDMRSLLLEELESGIPPTGSSQAPQEQASASSKYQEMLKKAKGEFE